MASSHSRCIFKYSLFMLACRHITSRLNHELKSFHNNTTEIDYVNNKARKKTFYHNILPPFWSFISKLRQDNQGIGDLNIAGNIISYHLTPITHDIFQSSVDSGQVPKPWNEANITAIFKKENRAETSNYRPISCDF